MNDVNLEKNEQETTEVRTYFVRERNALVARADFGALYIDYYLHLAAHGLRHAPAEDQLLKETLAALTLHCASRPQNETSAWTLNLQEPRLNLFVTGDNPNGNVIGNLFTSGVKERDENLFCAEVIAAGGPLRRSTVDFQGADIFRAVEHYYRQSEQRPARYFANGEEDFVMITAQPDCDMEWFDALDAKAVSALDENETLSLLEQRFYDYRCGCNHERMLAMLSPMMRQDPKMLFGDEAAITISCPRCGARHKITQEAMEAHISA